MPSESHKFWLFGNLKTHEALVIKDPTFSHIQDMARRGFTLVWDSAPNAEAGYEYGEVHGLKDTFFFREACCGCKNFAPVAMYQGNRWSEPRQRRIPFKGRICDMCASSNEFQVKAVPEKAKVSNA